MKRLIASLLSISFVLLWIGNAYPASKQYTALETSILFADAAQAEDATWTLSALASAAGRISARYDRGASSHAAFYKWRCTLQWTGTNVVGEYAEIYISTSDGTDPDGQIGTADASLASGKRNNLRFLGLVVADQTTTNTDTTGSGVVYIPDRYVSMGIWNTNSLPLKTDTAVHGCTLTPIPFEQQ